jgi:hypothetical protein
MLSCSPLRNSVNLDWQIIEWAWGRAQPGFGHMQVTGGSLEIAMTEQQLNAAQITAGVQQMRRERMAQHVRA